MKMSVTAKFTVDVDAWADEYGLDPSDVPAIRKDAASWVATTLNGATSVPARVETRCP